MQYAMQKATAPKERLECPSAEDEVDYKSAEHEGAPEEAEGQAV